MEDKRLKFGYEDTDKKIEIELYGLVFEIKDLEKIEESKSVDRNNINAVESVLEEILGRGSIVRINEKRIKDGREKLSLLNELNILGCIFQAYANTMKNSVKNSVNKVTENINKDMNNFNREQRRSYNRNQYRGNRRNYRRY